VTLTGALSGVKVLEFGNLISAAYCTRLLADLGAEVVKVEQPTVGDGARAAGPFPGDVPNAESSGLHLHLNANKLGITLNAKDNLGREIFKKLVSETDILVENNAPGLTKEWGLDYDSLRQVNADLIMVSITPFGQSGPYSNYKATEFTVYHGSGLGFATPGRVDDPDTCPPLWSRASLPSFMAGLAGAASAVQSLIGRDVQGSGEHIDISMQAVCAGVSLTNLASYFYQGANPSRLKLGTGIPAPAHILPAKDGYINLECLEESQWAAFVEAMGNPEWASEELFRDRYSRGEFWDALEPFLCEMTAKWNKEDISKYLQGKGVPCTPVNTMADLSASEQLKVREYFLNINHPVAGDLKYLGFPFKMSETPCNVRCPAPLLGQHNSEYWGTDWVTVEKTC
jgi:crotonobetainyl-CoA:carnitine CoA-transferase CaiB-like acyl-CoA transferase